MAEDRDQLIDEPTMEKMSVAPPDPETEAQERGDDSTSSSKAPRTDGQPESETMMQDTAADAASGVADQDPLSAHPS